MYSTTHMSFSFHYPCLRYCHHFYDFFMFVVMFVFQIRVVNAFRMGLDRRYDSSSLSSVRSYHSLQSAKTHKQQHPPTSPLASPDVHPQNENTTSL